MHLGGLEFGAKTSTSCPEFDKKRSVKAMNDQSTQKNRMGVLS